MTMTELAQFAQVPSVEKLRLETVRRSLMVERVEAVTPGMLRVTLGGPQLEGFHSPSPDDHIKIFFAGADGGIEARDYTPRRFDGKTLTIDFVVHAGGVGANWAQNAKPGDLLQMGGPRGSSVVQAPWWLLVGDETALPSIGRRLEELAVGTKVVCVVAVTGVEEQQTFATSADLTMFWVHRKHAADAAPLLEAVKAVALPAGPGYVWIAAEAGVSRAVREYVVEELGHAEEWTKAAAYWTAAVGESV